MRKSVMVIICILTLLSLILYLQKAANIDPADGNKGKKEDETRMLKMNDSKDGVVVDDLLDSLEMLGKTAEDSGIPREVIDMNPKGLRKTYIEGNIFGKDDYGLLYFHHTDDKERLVVEKVWIHIKETSYDECKDLLTEKFGDPIDQGDNPYVEVDGGAVEWTIFRHEDVKIRLSSASERDFIELSLEKISN